MTGTLIHHIDRPDIMFHDGVCYGGLHCGECFEVYLNRWVQVRLEHWDDWIFILEGKAYPIIYGIPVRK